LPAAYLGGNLSLPKDIEISMTELHTIFQSGNEEQGWSGTLQISQNGELYWNGEPIQMKQKIRLSSWINLAVGLGALATVVQAAIAVLEYLRC